jgi:hypothetical protein
MKFRVLSASVFALLISQVSAQVCNDQIKPSSPAERFVELGGGRVLDVVTMLSWDLCLLGQDYVGGICTGSPYAYGDWGDALVAANNSGGRLPNIKELSTLVERSCVEPAINQEVFADTPLYLFWTSTPDESGVGRIIDFTDGTEIVRAVNKPRVVRLVWDGVK